MLDTVEFLKQAIKKRERRSKFAKKAVQFYVYLPVGLLAEIDLMSMESGRNSISGEIVHLICTHHDVNYDGYIPGEDDDVYW